MAQDIELNLTFKPIKLDLEIDMAAISWGDVLALRKMESVGEDQALEYMTQIVSNVTGQDAAQMPAQAVSVIMEQIMARVNDDEPGSNGTGPNPKKD